jgi:hypothetical protein
MSLVGPRPLLLAEDARVNGRYEAEDLKLLLRTVSAVVKPRGAY